MTNVNIDTPGLCIALRRRGCNARHDFPKKFEFQGGSEELALDTMGLNQNPPWVCDCSCVAQRNSRARLGSQLVKVRTSVKAAQVRQQHLLQGCGLNRP